MFKNILELKKIHMYTKHHQHLYDLIYESFPKTGPKVRVAITASWPMDLVPYFTGGVEALIS